VKRGVALHRFTSGSSLDPHRNLSPQQRLKSRLSKVLVMRQCRLHLLCFHHLKIRAIRQAPTLIRRLLVAPQRALKSLRYLWNDDHIPIASNSPHHAPISKSLVQEVIITCSQS